jgi:acyl-CoA synthetase (AMP-forming)/AMP-acid ligase II
MQKQKVNHSTLVQLLRYRAQYQPHKTAYIFLRDGETKEDKITYFELDRQARAIAWRLRSLIPSGSRVLLIYPYNAGIEFITAFFGCLYAGIVAVSSNPPQTRSAVRSLQGRLASSEAKVILTTKQLVGKIKNQLADSLSGEALNELIWLTIQEIGIDRADDWHEPDINKDTLAFLQYTSGSTGMPKGVMITHECMMSNQQMLELAFDGNEQSVGVGWLPLFHDMGLIGNVLHSLYLGIPCVLMSPISFIQKPIRWLQAVSRYKGTISGGPNFAYDLLCRQVTQKQKENLDLSSWDLAFCGAEPIRTETIEEFARSFADCGFRPEAFYPCYGMAEATLFITGGLKTDLPVIKSFAETALEQNRVVIADSQQKQVRSVIGCGRAWLDEKIVIVDPQSLTQCPDDRIGEIWVASKGVAKGYWNMPEETERTFQAYVKDTGEGPFLRTGDLGFLLDEELFITGRLKEVMMFWGLSHYPQHIEQTVEKCHPALHPNGGAAFAISVAGEERLAIAHEIERSHRQHLMVNEVVEAIRWTVFREHLIDVHAITLLKPGSLPRTSSGKIQRRLCREQFLAGSLKGIGEWRSPEGSSNDIASVIQRYLNPMTHLKRYSGILGGKVRRALYQVVNMGTK